MRVANLVKLALSSPKCEGKLLFNQYARFLSTTSNAPVKSSRLQETETSFRRVESEDEFMKQLQPAGSNVELDDLECQLQGQRLSFNLTWLRDSCHCEQCTHKFSRQRLFTPKDFRKSLFEVSHVQVVPKKAASRYIAATNKAHDQIEDSYLNVKWSDGHDSFYSINWLSHVHNLYDKPLIGRSERSRALYLLPKDDLYAARDENQPEYQSWSVESIQANLIPIDYSDLLDGFEFHDDMPTFINANRINDMSTKRFDSMVSLSDQLSKFGLAKIVKVPQERNQVLKVARSLAYERPTGYGTIFDVVIEPSEEINLAYSSQEFDLHSDLTYREKSPGVQMLHCIRNSVDGGLSFFSDTFKAAEIMGRENPVLYNVLVQFPAVFVVRDPYRDVKFRRQKPILTLDHAGELDEVYYSPFMLPPIGHKEDLKLFYLAQDMFTQLLQAKENKLITKMDAGDLFIFNNRRVLHGRSSYDPKTSNRFLQGCYMDWDEIICLHEKFHSIKR